MTITERFGENLLVLRRRAGHSQERLARRAELHRNEVSALECEDRLARIDTVVKLAGALDVPPERLLKGIAWTPAREGKGRLLITPAGRSDLRLADE